MASWILWFNFLLMLLMLGSGTYIAINIFKRFALLEQNLAAAKSDKETLDQAYKELKTHLYTHIHQLEQLKARVAEYEDQLQSLHDIDPESRLYSRAVKMIALGADLQELISECELPKAEAELLLNLHRTQKKSA